MKKLIEKKSEAEFAELEKQIKEGGEPKLKICIRCNSPFPAHLKGKVCGCVVEWLVEEQFKSASNKPEEKEAKAQANSDVQHLPSVGSSPSNIAKEPAFAMRLAQKNES